MNISEKLKNLLSAARRHVAPTALAVVMTAGVAMPVSAATVPNATIDTSKSASLTIYKYDQTAAALDGVTVSPTATGYQDTDVETAYADYGIKGVEFTIYDFASISTYSTVEDGSNKIEVVYGVDSTASADVLTALSLTADDALQVDGSTYYYTSDVLNKALEDALTTDAVSTRNVLESYIVSADSTVMPETDENGCTTLSDLPLGLYLVVETKIPEQVTSTVEPFFVSLPMTQNDGDEWNYNVRCYPKNESGMPSMNKTVTEVTTAKAEDYAPTATASDGDIVAYHIDTTLPTINSKATYLSRFDWLDTLSDGIEYNQASPVTIDVYSDSACTNLLASWDQDSGMFTVTYGVLEDGSTTMYVQLTEAGLAAANPAYSDCTMRISYTATVNSDATVVYGENGNPNDVTLTWQRTSMNYYDTLKDRCIVYTFGLDVTKQFSDNKGDFSAVSFKIQNTSDNFYLIAAKASDGVYYVTGKACKTADEAAATAFVPASDGSLKIYGVEDDSYVITELTTADGYTLLKDAVSVAIATETHDVEFQQNDAACADGAADGVAYDNYIQTSTNATRTVSATVNGNAVTMEDIASSANALAPMTIVNTPGFKLPQTGGAGTAAVVIIGCVLLAAAGAVYVTGKKRKAE